jgi:hypothetical protein
MNDFFFPPQHTQTQLWLTKFSQISIVRRVMIRCGGLKFSIVCYLEYKKSTNYILFIPSSFIIHAKYIHLKSHQYFHASVLEKKTGKKKVAEIGAAKSMLNLQIS